MEIENVENSRDDGPVIVTLLDYTESLDATEIDTGIRETIRGIRVSILAMGIGLANMKAKGLYRDLDCKNMTQYIRRLGDETKMDISSLFRYLSVGEIYLKYKNDLESAGFIENDGPTKLPYLERALSKNNKQDVFDNIRNMSVREFIDFAKGPAAVDIPPRGRWAVTVRGNAVYINGKLAVIVSNKTDKRISAYFRKVIGIVCETISTQGVILTTPLRNMRDADRLELEIIQLKKRLGMR